MAFHEIIVSQFTTIMDGVKTEGTRDPFGNIVFILPDVEYATLKCVSELLYTGSTSGPIGLKNQVKHLLRDNFFNAMFFTTSEDIVVKNVNAKINRQKEEVRRKGHFGKPTLMQGGSSESDLMHINGKQSGAICHDKSIPTKTLSHDSVSSSINKSDLTTDEAETEVEGLEEKNSTLSDVEEPSLSEPAKKKMRANLGKCDNKTLAILNQSKSQTKFGMSEKGKSIKDEMTAATLKKYNDLVIQQKVKRYQPIKPAPEKVQSKDMINNTSALKSQSEDQNTEVGQSNREVKTMTIEGNLAESAIKRAFRSRAANGNVIDTLMAQHKKTLKEAAAKQPVPMLHVPAEENSTSQTTPLKDQPGQLSTAPIHHHNSNFQDEIKTYKESTSTPNQQKTQNILNKTATQKHSPKPRIMNESIIRNSVQKMVSPKTDTPYKCDQCDKSFKQQSSLKIHQRLHTKAELKATTATYKTIVHYNGTRIEGEGGNPNEGNKKGNTESIVDALQRSVSYNKAVRELHSDQSVTVIQQTDTENFRDMPNLF